MAANARIGTLVGLAILLAGCSSSSPTTPTAPQLPATVLSTAARFEFQVAPLAGSEFVGTVGRNWTGYFTSTASFSRTWGLDAIVAPAAGRVVAVAADSSRWRVDFVGAGLTRFYITGLASTTLTEGLEVKAGELIGMRARDSRGRGLGIGLGVMKLIPELFLVPSRYSDDVLYCDDPINYFTEPLKSQLRVLSGPGLLPFSDDVVGTLMGHWFDEGLAVAGSAASSLGKDRLWFVHTSRGPGGAAVAPQLRILGSNLLSGTPQPGVPDPATITVTSGLVKYHFEPFTPSAWPEVLLVQMVSSGRLRAEAWYGNPSAEPDGFSASARTFIR